MTDVYLVRHAQTSGNKTRTFQGRTDADITEEGASQLKYLAERFKNISFDKIYSSPLQRARKTAQAVNLYHNKELVLEEGIIEIDVGKLEGIPFAELYQLYPEDVQVFINTPHLFKSPGGESMMQVYERMVTTLGRLVGENKGSRIVVVTHGCALQNYLAYALGYGQEGIQRAPICLNTAVTHLRFTENGLPFVVALNDASHLSAEQLEQGKWELKP
ncbi:histidine phosphatase family protein [Acetanaerobacterium elongatum]|uniref:Probable phosphoglycerate mutase n=1 Tax=Acetanaerobacterium elongatum TaxID=258515 RepID=A0A1H0FQJ8_9FIRM|nr:histidine phosphatase family protein [Acetanaerobacterium elongatum]SDN96946.1 probable phosphoglycerate mutase [Acetanaerobacterium elongatum]